MRRVMLLSVGIMLCAGLALAQDTPSNGSTSQNETTTTSTTTTDQSASSNTIQGCLMGTSGNYMLTDATGVAYKVQGDESQLSSNVNKEVEVMGTVSSTASASASNNADTGAPNSGSQGDANTASGSSTGAAATATASKTLNATSVKMVADSCSGK